MLRVRQIKVEVESDNEENLLKAICKKLRISKEDVVNFIIHKQSIDARNKECIYYVYEVNVELKNEKQTRNAFVFRFYSFFGLSNAGL